MGKCKKLSVIVPVYNVDKYIERGLNSLLVQTYKNIEIIIVDDGSTDRSGIICDEYQKMDSRIRVVHKENGGIVSARKAGIKLATGEYAVNFDPDDWIEENAYENVMEIIEKYNPDIVAYGMKKEFNNFIEEQPIQIKEGIYTRGEFWDAFCMKVSEHPFFSQPVIMSQCDKVVKTELFKKHQLGCTETLKKNVDDAVVFPMLLDMNKIYIDERCWYHYCVRKNSILWQTKKNDDTRYKILALHLIDAYRKYGADSGCSLDFLLYKLVHHLMLDTPEALFDGEQCRIYPKISHDSKMIVYGKGVFANRFMNSIKEKHYCDIIANIDSSDVERLNEIDNELYDFIVIAIFNAKIVLSILDLLADMKIDKNKILIIEKESITPEFLPDEVRESFSKLQ